ncbi:transketolase-like [Liolophura sinensis]|uniref:transketolase-like n=1 Tax=Liolophura sinensis TaxID=3198878 RepID=UPI0031584B7D
MPSVNQLSEEKAQLLNDIANTLRVHSIRSTNIAGSGHPTTCCSAAEMMSVLFFHTMKYKVEKPRDPSSDRFVLSKGHAAPILYAAWAEAGLFPVGDLDKLRKTGCDLEGHPTPRLDFVDVATGSLGQGLSCAAGMAYTGKYFDKASYRVYCLLGDGETAEGSVWEALAFCSYYKLDNIVAVFDINRLGQSDPTSVQHDMDCYKIRLEALGWNVVVVDGHDVSALAKALEDTKSISGKPCAVLGKTFKGRGVPGVEDQMNFHGKPLGEKGEVAIAELKKLIKNPGPYKITPPAPTDDAKEVKNSKITLSEPPNYQMGDVLPIRNSYGTALVKIAKNSDQIVALDGDMKNSTFSQKLADVYPNRFVECFIAEQNMVGVAVGCGTRGRTIPFASTFACFLTRAFDQIRMAAISQANIKFCGSHCGVSIGEDGPSQMALEDIAMFRSIPGSTVFYPSDSVAIERAVELAANTTGICFIRATRPVTPIIYKNDEVFQVGQAKVVRQSPDDKVTVIGAGITLSEAMKAADKLAASGVKITVVDPFTIKPLDVDTIKEAAKKTGGRIVVVEDHYPEGGIGEAVSMALGCCRDIVIRHLAVRDVPRSGKPVELLELFGINDDAIVKAVNQILKE